MENELLQKFITNAPEPFFPLKLPVDYYPAIANDKELFKILNQANNSFGEYRGYLGSIMNPHLLISPLISQEAVLSSKLEGTHATLEDLLNFDANVATKIDKDEMQEIANYRKALFYAMDRLSVFGVEDNKLPLSTRIIKEMHKILLNNARGNTKNPGNFKRQQNYIVSASGTVFTPVPAHAVNEYMSNLENYFHSEESSILLQTAILHVQFEMIHPFEDGNGRIGRLLIPLFLYYRKELPLPTFYMSSYFNRDRSMYLKMLNSVSTTGEWTQWLKYFLNGIVFSSQEGIQKAKQINGLYEKFKNDEFNRLNSAHAIQILDFIFQHPLFTAKQLETDTSIPYRTVNTLLKRLVETKCISKNEAKRNALFYCAPLIKLL